MFKIEELKTIVIDGLKEWLSRCGDKKLNLILKESDNGHFVLNDGDISAFVLFKPLGRNDLHDLLIYTYKGAVSDNIKKIVFEQLDVIFKQHIKDEACSGYNFIYESTNSLKDLTSLPGVMEVSESIAHEYNYQTGFICRCEEKYCSLHKDEDLDALSFELKNYIAGPSFICGCTKEEVEWFNSSDTTFDKLNVVWLDWFIGSSMSMAYGKAKEIAEILKAKYNKQKYGYAYFDGDRIDVLEDNDVYSPDIEKILYLTERKNCSEPVTPLFPYSLFSKYAYKDEVIKAVEDNEDTLYLSSYFRIFKEFSKTVSLELYCLALAYYELNKDSLNEMFEPDVKEDAMKVIIEKAKEYGFTVNDLLDVEPKFLSLYKNTVKGCHE